MKWKSETRITIDDIYDLYLKLLDEHRWLCNRKDGSQRMNFCVVFKIHEHPQNHFISSVLKG